MDDEALIIYVPEAVRQRRHSDAAADVVLCFLLLLDIFTLEHFLTKHYEHGMFNFFYLLCMSSG